MLTSKLARNTKTFRALTALLAVAAFGLGACTGESASGPTGPDGGQSAGPAPAKITVQPAAGAKEVSPAEPIQVTVGDGTVEAVTLTNPDGKQVGGQIAPDKRTWATTEPLGYNKTYTWAGTALGTDGKQVPISGSFTTVAPKKLVNGQLNVKDNETYGIAMPLSVTFDSGVTSPEARAAVERALVVETNPKTEGSWAWPDGEAVRWRPKEYWKPGTEVKVSANLYGVSLGNGAYGKQNVAAQFKIGRSQIVKGNTQTHRMQVIRDGQQVGDYATSYGLDSDPGRVTNSGIHVVMEKYPKYFMTNARYDYENFEVDWAVRISNNGEFTHSAPWSLGDQGNKNVSHGCLNLSPENAKAFYDSAMMGDPVEIEGSSQKLGKDDYAYFDWTYTWEQWTAMSALNS